MSTMTAAAETIIRTLSASGWREAALRPDTDAHLAHGRVEVDHRPARGELWLWILGPDDKRCLGLAYGAHLETVLAWIVAHADALTLDDYLSTYLELQAMCPASIIAWEQFEEPAARNPTATWTKKERGPGWTR
jgi:hypothetical protein